MKKFTIACLMAAFTTMAFAQYTGPGGEGTPTTVKQLHDTGWNDQRVMLRGHIVKSIGDEQYQFTDGTGDIPVKIDRKRWPVDQPVNETTTVELIGKYDKELVGISKVKVQNIKIVQ